METSKKTSYKYCVVPKCKNTTIKTPNKLFFNVPREAKARQQWCNAMKRDEKKYKKLAVKSRLYCCEDHFNIHEDMENYVQYRIMGHVHIAKLKLGVIPRLFECQRVGPSTCITRTGALKRRRLELVQEALLEATKKDVKIPVRRALTSTERSKLWYQRKKLKEKNSSVQSSVSQNNESIENNSSTSSDVIKTDNKQAYSCKEKVILTSIVEKYKIIIENKKTNTEDNKKKKEAWLLIEANYNSHPDVDCKRTAQQLKKCWENLKQRRRKNRTDESKSYLATSSEPPLKIPKPDPKLTEVVSSTAPVSDLDIDSSTDSTAVYQQKDVLCTSTEKHEEAAKLTYEATPTPSFSHVEVFLDLEKTLRIQKLNESIEHQKVLQNLQVEAAIAELNAKKYEEEYWKKKLESL